MRKAPVAICVFVTAGTCAWASENYPSAGWCDELGKKWQLYEFVELTKNFYCEITRIPKSGQTIKLRSSCSGQGRFRAVWLTMHREGDKLTISPSEDYPQDFGSVLGVSKFNECGPD